MLGNAAPAQAGAAPPVPATPTPTASGPLQSADPASKPPTNPTPTDSTGPSAEPSASDAAVLAADDDWTVEDTIRFWTPERMDSATYPSGRTAPPEGLTAAAQRPSASGIAAQHFKGIKSVGTIFSKDEGLKGHRCTASVVRSGGHNLILTAGHSSVSRGGWALSCGRCRRSATASS